MTGSTAHAQLLLPSYTQPRTPFLSARGAGTVHSESESATTTVSFVGLIRCTHGLNIGMALMKNAKPVNNAGDMSSIVPFVFDRVLISTLSATQS